ncbi:MAG TPA: ScyD/ScyE family protein [Nakamurella sp.]
MILLPSQTWSPTTNTARGPTQAPNPAPHAPASAKVDSATKWGRSTSNPGEFGRASSMQAVPISVATVGYDGSYYISQLTGFPFPKGAANIYRIDPRGGDPTVNASGLTNVTDLAFNGRELYAVQISTEGLLTGPTGSLVKVKRDGRFRPITR